MVYVAKEGTSEMDMATGRVQFLQPKKRWKRRKFVKRNETKWSHVPSLTPGGAYEPPRLSDLQQRNRLKTRKYFPKKGRAPRAPRNTTSFIMRAKKSGGLASLVSPATPAIFATPIFSPAPRYREGLVDEVNKEWGVDGYGSMNGLIRLRCHDHLNRENLVAVTESESDMEHNSLNQSVLQLEQRIDHDLSRFEIVYPPSNSVVASKSMDTIVEEQDSRIAQLEDENLSLKERLYLLQQELVDLQQKLQLDECRTSICEQAEVRASRGVL